MSDERTRPAEPNRTARPAARRLAAGAAVAVLAGGVGAALFAADDRPASTDTVAHGAGHDDEHGPVVVEYRGPQRLVDALPNVYWEDGTGRRPASVDAFVGHVVDVVAAGGSATVGPHPMEGQEVAQDACDETAELCSLLVHIAVDDPLAGRSSVGDVHVAEVRLRGPAYAAGADTAGMAGPEDMDEWEQRLRAVDRGFCLLTAPTGRPGATGLFAHGRLASVDDDGRIVPHFGTPASNETWYGELTTVDAVRSASRGPERTVDANAAASAAGT